MATKCGLEREADGTAKRVKYFDADPSHGSFLRGKNKNVTVGDFPERDLMDSDVDHDEDVGDDDKEIEKAGGARYSGASLFGKFRRCMCKSCLPSNSYACNITCMYGLLCTKYYALSTYLPTSTYTYVPNSTYVQHLLLLLLLLPTTTTTTTSTSY